jgi:hypothetical protein
MYSITPLLTLMVCSAHHRGVIANHVARTSRRCICVLGREIGVRQGQTPGANSTIGGSGSGSKRIGLQVLEDIDIGQISQTSLQSPVSLPLPPEPSDISVLKCFGPLDPSATLKNLLQGRGG